MLVKHFRGGLHSERFITTDDDRLVFSENNKTVVKYHVGHEFYAYINYDVFLYNTSFLVTTSC